MARSSEVPPARVPYPSRQEAPADEALPIRSQGLPPEAVTVQRTLPGSEYQSAPRHCHTPHENAVGVIVEKHLDNNAEEAADLRHE